MIVKFQTVSATNFRSFKHFTLDLEDAGVSLVQGKIEGGSETLESNGAGKSSIFSAISWALFGKFVHVSGAKVSGDKVIRRGSQGGTHVSVVLQTDDHRLIVERYRGHEVHGDKIRLFVDGKLATQSSNPKTQLLIEALLGTTPELFFNLIYISEATLRESFAFESDAQRKKILVGALPQFQQFNKARAAVKDSLGNYIDSIKKLESELSAHTMAVSELKATSQGVDTEGVEARIKELSTLDVYRSKMYDAIKIQIDTLKTEAKILGEKDPVLHEKVKTSTETLTRLQQEMTGLFAEQKLLKKSIQKFATLSGVCPTCEQLILPDQRQKHEDEYREKLEQCESKIDLLTNQLTVAMDDHSNAMLEREELLQTIRSLLKQVELHERECREWDSLRHAGDAERERLLIFLSRVSDAQAATELRMNELNIRVEELKTLIHTAKQYESALRNWLDGFGPRGVVSHGLNQVLDILTEKTAQWLWKLWHEGATFQFEFSGDDLSKIEAKLFLNQTLVDVESLSSGETRRLCLAICFGLREALQTLVGWRSNLLVLDEVFDGLDGQGRMKVLHELKTLPETNTFVISQFPQLCEDIDRTMLVTFSSGISTLNISGE